jgi:hypothetical protein
MGETGVILSTTREMEGNLIYKFKTAAGLESGSQILCGYPKGYEVKCKADDGNLLLMTLKEGGEVTCTNYPRQLYFVLDIPEPIPAGSQAFAVRSIAPKITAQSNLFFIQIRGPAGEIVDGDMVIQGLPTLDGWPKPTVFGFPWPLLWGDPMNSNGELCPVQFGVGQVENMYNCDSFMNRGLDMYWPKLSQYTKTKLGDAALLVQDRRIFFSRSEPGEVARIGIGFNLVSSLKAELTRLMGVWEQLTTAEKEAFESRWFQLLKEDEQQHVVKETIPTIREFFVQDYVGWANNLIKTWNDYKGTAESILEALGDEEEEIPPDYNGTVPLREKIPTEVLIELPYDYQHQVTKITDLNFICCQTEQMPITRISVTDSSGNLDATKLRLFLDPVAMMIAPAGPYTVTFPVVVPQLMPGFNVFQMTICTPGTGDCEVRSPRALVTIAVPAFDHGESPNYKWGARTGCSFGLSVNIFIMAFAVGGVTLLGLPAMTSA